MSLHQTHSNFLLLFLRGDKVVFVTTLHWRIDGTGEADSIVYLVTSVTPESLPISRRTKVFSQAIAYCDKQTQKCAVWMTPFAGVRFNFVAEAIRFIVQKERSNNFACMLRKSCISRYHLFRRAVVREHGGIDKVVVEDFTAKDLVVGPNDVLVRNSFAGVNFIDTYFRTGLYKKPALPYVVGEEGSGAIVKVGDNVPKERLGQRVAFFAGSSGTYSSFSTVSQQDAFAIPDGVGDDVAAAAMLQGCTAHYLTESVYKAQPGDVVLVHAAAGGTGLLLTQMAKRRGAIVVGTCGGAAKAAIAQSHGSVDHIIDYTQNGGDWVSRVRELFPDGVHCVYDGVGRSTFTQSLKALRRRGTMATFGNASGTIDPVSPMVLAQHGSIVLQRPSLKDFALHANNEAKGRVDDVLNAVSKGELKVLVGKVFPLQSAQGAHAYLEERKSTGKILINCQE